MKAAVQESQKKGNVPEEIQKEDKTSAQTYEIGIDESAGMHNKPFKDEQEKLLQQFFPDEWMSMLDCRS